MRKYFLFHFFAVAAGAATSVSQYGITWGFSADHPVGQYANGDYYVVAPAGLSITSITPASTLAGGRTINGTMVNPVAGRGVKHGCDSSVTGYDAALNRGRPGGQTLGSSNPLIVAAGSSVLSTVSHATAGRRPVLTDAAVLTVVASAPASGAFRPPYCGTDKSHNWNKANLNYAILKNHPPVPGTPALSTSEAQLARPWIEVNTSHDGRYIHPVNNQPDYGAFMAGWTGPALLQLHLDYSAAAKEPLYVRLVQMGLDIYGAARTGGYWEANGGHNLGRKMPMLLAGLALADANILSYANKAAHNIFQEDEQTFVVDAAQLLVVPYTADGRTRLPYNSGHLGLAEWGEKHRSQKNRDGSNWGVTYRDICYRALMAHALAAHLTTGAVAAWNWPPFFDYYDRAKSIAGPEQFGVFVHGMWVTYRNPVTATVPAGPTGLSASPTANRLIALTWSPPAGTVDYQIVERSTTSGSGFAPIANVAGDASAFTDPTPLAAVPYFYRVRAGNGSGSGPYSPETQATPAAPARIRVHRSAGSMVNN